MELEDMTMRNGVYINPEDKWYEWNPANLTNNIYMIVGSLSGQLGKGFQPTDKPEKHPTKDNWWIWRWEKDE